MSEPGVGPALQEPFDYSGVQTQVKKPGSLGRVIMDRKVMNEPIM
jgi:hypothetical protein